MAISKQDERTLAALASARAQHEELAGLLDFYYDLYELQFKAKADVPEPEIRDETAMRWRLEGGIPQLTFDQLKVEPEPFACLVDGVSEILLKHNPSWSFQEELAPNGLVQLAREVFEKWDTLTGPQHSRETGSEPPAGRPVAMAVGFALGPYLQGAAEVIQPRLDLPLWSEGYCPVCGGRANFAVLGEETGARGLMCSRCTAQWDYARLPCPFCDTEEWPTYYASEDELHRLYMCSECNGYLKTVDLRKAKHVVFPIVERLLTVGMDLAAQQEGFGD